MDLFWAAHWWGKAKKAHLPKMCHIYPTMMKLGIVTSYLKKIQAFWFSASWIGLKPDTYWEPSQRLRWRFLQKHYNFFKALYLIFLTRFGIHSSLNKYSLTCTVDLCYVLYVTYSQPWHLQKPVCYWKLRHIHVLFRRIYSHIELI